MPLLSRTAREIRVAVTGLGKMGTFHLSALHHLAHGESEAYYKSGLRSQVGKIRICGVCDIDPGRAGASPDTPFFQDHLTLLRETHPDIAIIATPSRSHYDLALAALQAGSHCLVEKPATPCVSDWDRLAAHAAQQDLRIMAGHVERYNPVSIKLRSLLQERAMTANHYTFMRCQRHDPRIQDDIVLDKLIHDLDLALFFFGAITSHELVSFRKVDGQTREVVVVLTHQSGVRGELFVSWMRDDEPRTRECRLLTAEGDNVHGDFVAKRLLINSVETECAVPGWVKPDNNQIKDELADFVGYCLEPDPAFDAIQPLLSPAEVRSALSIIGQVTGEIDRHEHHGTGRTPSRSNP